MSSYIPVSASSNVSVSPVRFGLNLAAKFIDEADRLRLASSHSPVGSILKATGKIFSAVAVLTLFSFLPPDAQAGVGNQSCAITSAGTVKCWGNNSDGQLGDGTTADKTTPVDVLLSSGGDMLTGVTKLTAGARHTCALLSTGGVKCWGYNGFGQLGDGANANKTTPVDVLGSPGGAALGGVTEITAGGYYTCALMSAGGVKCWGSNNHGQLGDGTTTNRTTPVDVVVSPGGASLGGVSQVTAGVFHTCALLSTGTVKCWGSNSDGQLGDGTTTERTTPVDVVSSPGGAVLSGVTQITGGGYYTCAFLTAGTVKCWSNRSPQAPPTPARW